MIVLGKDKVEAESLWLIQTELERDRDRDQEKNGLHYFMFDIQTATYVGTYTLALYSPGLVQALSEWAIMSWPIG